VNRRLKARRSSAARALGTALAVALVGVLPVVGDRGLAPQVEAPVRSADSAQRPVLRLGTDPPSGAARGSDLPGLEATTPTSTPSPDVERSGGHVSQPGAGGPVPPTAAPGRPTSTVLYLTFDDGPDPTWTPRVLAVLRQYGVTATFFELGVQVHEHPTLPGLVRRQGHRVGNHTYDHKSLPTLTDAQLRRQILRGPSATCLRPPFGDVDGCVRAAAARAGQTVVLWDVDTRDWAEPGTPHIVRAVLDNAHPGATILMHDAGGDRSQTVAALRIVLPRLLAQGYTFATVPGC
jgi:peptidoglycan/xylan/chitin deacetylase (PgdA/CDA1 family)